MNFTADSKQYIHVAQQIYQNGFISIWKNEDLVNWPPLYPIILSFLTNSDTYSAIKIFHVILVVLLFVIWDIISRELLITRGLRFSFMILLSLTTNILMITVFIWSELLFLVLFSMVLFCMLRLIRSGKISWLILSIIPSFLMLIQRNAGIFIITPIYIALIIFRVLSKPGIRIAIFCFLTSISGFLVWNIKNIIIERRSYMIKELLPYFTPIKNYSMLVNDVGSLFYPSFALFPISILLTSALMIIASSYIFRSAKDPFPKVLLFTSLLYLFIWIIIPGDPSNMGRFISIVSPILIMVFLKALHLIWSKFNLRMVYMYILIGSIIAYTALRAVNNSFLWGGRQSYINFGKIHGNSFYEKSDRIIGRPSTSD